MDYCPKGPVGELGRKTARSTLKNSLCEPFWKGGRRRPPLATAGRRQPTSAAAPRGRRRGSFFDVTVAETWSRSPSRKPVRGHRRGNLVEVNVAETLLRPPSRKPSRGHRRGNQRPREESPREDETCIKAGRATTTREDNSSLDATSRSAEPLCERHPRSHARPIYPREERPRANKTQLRTDCLSMLSKSTLA